MKYQVYRAKEHRADMGRRRLGLREFMHIAVPNSTFCRSHNTLPLAP